MLRDTPAGSSPQPVSPLCTTCFSNGHVDRGVNPAWWGAGLGVVLWIGPQLVIGVLEGNSTPGEDYTVLIASSPFRYIAIIALSVVAATAVYTWRWRGPRAVET